MFPQYTIPELTYSKALGVYHLTDTSLALRELSVSGETRLREATAGSS